MLKHIIAASAAAGIVVAGLTVTTAPAQSQAQQRPGLRAVSALGISAPDRIREGSPFRVVVRTGHRDGRVTLLRKGPRGAWRAVAHTRATQSLRKVAFSRVEKAAGAVRYQATMRGLSTPVHRVLVTARPTSMLIMGSSGGPNGDIMVNDTYTVSATLLRGDSPIVGRAVRIERQDPGKTTWTTMGTYVTDDQGEASFPDSSDTQGLVRYRGTSRELTGMTVVGVFKDVPMPTTGPDLAISTSRPCAQASLTGGAAVDLTLRAGAAPCALAAGDSVAVTWHLRGLCTPISLDDLGFTGPATGVEVQVTVDGEPFIDKHLGPNQGTGHLGISGDPPDDLTITMALSSGTAGTYVGTISNLSAHCL